MRCISPGEMLVGEPVSWDIYGNGGSLLVRKGHLVASDAQKELLIERGLIADMPPETADGAAVAAPSALRLINQACTELQALLGQIVAGGGDARPGMARVAALVVEAADVNTDVALACILHNQDAHPFPVRHSVDTAVVALLVARARKQAPDAILSLVSAALVMNVGMLEQHERLQQTSTPLSPQDQAYIRGHPKAGVALLRAAGVDDQLCLKTVLQHHENHDGSGYPFCLGTDLIVESAKILALADRYCARLAGRAYRKPMSANAALRDILLEGKQTVDVQLASLMIRELGIYPIGTFVKLVNGEVGVVTHKGVNSTTPHVLALLGPRGAELPVPVRRDTRVELHTIREVLSAQQVGIVFQLQHIWGRAASV